MVPMYYCLTKDNSYAIKVMGNRLKTEIAILFL